MIKKQNKSILVGSILNAIILIGAFFVIVLAVREIIEIIQACFLSFFLGGFLAFNALHKTRIKQALILRKYVTWDKDAMKTRLDEINS